MVALLMAWIAPVRVPGQEQVDGTAAAAMREVEIATVPGRLMFTPRAIAALPGEKLRLKVRNTGRIPHNFVLCTEGADNWQQVAHLVIDLGESARALNFHPGPPLVTHATPVLAPGEEAVLEWQAPDRDGVFPYLSSVPGHAPLMRGVLNVSSTPGGLSNLQYFYYEGTWDTLPDFSELQPFASGKLPGTSIDLDAIQVLREREKEREPEAMGALVVTADARLLAMGSYSFQLRTKHAASLSLADVTLLLEEEKDDGTRTFHADDVDDGTFGLVLALMDSGPLRTPWLAWRGPAGTEVVAAPGEGAAGALASREDYVIRPHQPGEEPVPLAVTVPMPGASALALAVALPNQGNYCFDPDTLSVRYAWIGGFLDAAPVGDDGSGRPGGNCRPLGATVPLGAGTRFPLRIGDLAGEAPEVRYLGHTSGSAITEPELLFEVSDFTVAQKVTVQQAADAADGLPPAVEYAFTIDPAPGPDVPLLFHADPAHVTITTPHGFARDGVAVINLPRDQRAFAIRLEPVRQPDD